MIIEDIKKGSVYVDENGNVLTVRKVDAEDGFVVVDLEGEFKTFVDPQSFENFIKEKGFQETDNDANLNDEDGEEEVDGELSPPEDDETDEQEEDEPVVDPEDDDTDEEEDDEIPTEPEEEPESDNKVQKFKDLYVQMLDLGATGNDKIDSALAKLKKELSDQLNILTAESTDFDQLYNMLAEQGYLKKDK